MRLLEKLGVGIPGEGVEAIFVVVFSKTLSPLLYLDNSLSFVAEVVLWVGGVGVC